MFNVAKKMYDFIIGESNSFTGRFLNLPNTVPMIKGKEMSGSQLVGLEEQNSRQDAETVARNANQKSHANLAEKSMRWEDFFAKVSASFASVLLIAGKILGRYFLLGLLTPQLAETASSIKKCYHVFRQKNMPPWSRTFAFLEAIGNIVVSTVLGLASVIQFAVGATFIASVVGVASVAGAAIISLALPCLAGAYFVKGLIHTGLGLSYFFQGKYAKDPNEKEACYGLAREQGSKATGSFVISFLAGGITALNFLLPAVIPILSFCVGFVGVGVVLVSSIAKRIWPMNKGGNPVSDNGNNYVSQYAALNQSSTINTVEASFTQEPSRTVPVERIRRRNYSVECPLSLFGSVGRFFCCFSRSNKNRNGSQDSVPHDSPIPSR